MRASDILQARLRDGAEIVHAKQWAALWRAVTGLLQGGQLWLTALGRSLPGDTADKHRIKAADRLLGSPKIQTAAPQLCGVLARFLLRRIRRPIILVDWTASGCSAFHILSATLCFSGRGLPIWSRTFPTKRKCSPQAEREFLADLVALMPRHCSPIIVTDAGFWFEWFEAVVAAGWDFVGRIRGKQKVRLRGDWLTLDQLFALAGKKPKNLGLCDAPRGNPRSFRFVLSKKPKLKGRHRLKADGTRRQRTADRQRSEAARQPWLLATSLGDRAALVVETYSKRMQIEETFRDLKNHRYGWSLEDVRCRTAARIDVLLLVATLATVAMHMVGLAARRRHLDRGLQANTERKRTVFSTFFLAKLAIARDLQSTISDASLREALAQIRQIAAQAALL
jgi:hypothetical protein